MSAFISQIGDGDAGNLTGTHDLQQASASQPIFQATGTEAVFICDCINTDKVELQGKVKQTSYKVTEISQLQSRQY